MAALAATDWTESVDDIYLMGKKRHTRVKLTLTNTDSFYPSSGGIPLPTTLGMKRNIDYVKIIQGLYPVSGATGKAAGIKTLYVVTEHSIHLYWESGATSTADAAPVHMGEVPTTWKPSSLGQDNVMYVEAVGW
jgi:hypothetical protein